MLNLRQLEIFREVIRCQTTVGAAEALAISQPAVSNAIRQIEAQLGLPLFDRVGNRLVPTDEAQEVMRGSEPIFSLYRAFSQKLKDLRDTRTGSLRVLSTPALANALVPRALKAFLSSRPDMHVFFDVRRTPGVVEGVETGFADVGFSLAPQQRAGIEASPISVGQMVCVCPPDHPLADRSEISARDLADYPLIGFEPGTPLGVALHQGFWTPALQERTMIETRYSSTACLLAESGVGIAVVDSFAVVGGRYQLAARPLSPRVPIEAFALTARHQPMKRVVRAFLREVQAEAARAEHAYKP
ncbi:MAG: LysR family transcriptional regulator [Proteobacteria bacterium]|nr:LysR family transcriptional regulator [Pseudomonadota bacterium]